MSDANGGNGATGPGGPGGSDAGSGGPRDWSGSGWGGSGGRGGWGGGRRLERKISGRWIAGVCAGVADYFGVDPTLIRIGFAVLFLVAGVGPIAYLVGWLLIPEEGEKASIAERMINKTEG